jgi:hypothetical protein
MARAATWCEHRITQFRVHSKLRMVFLFCVHFRIFFNYRSDVLIARYCSGDVCTSEKVTPKAVGDVRFNLQRSLSQTSAISSRQALSVIGLSLKDATRIECRIRLYV